MLFSSPVSFEEALASRRVKALMPTTASSYDLARLAPEIRERAIFSARTASARHLANINATVMRVLDPGYVYDPRTGEKRPAGPGESVNEARARELLRDSLRSIGYSPDQVGAAPGSLRDLGSERRLNLIVDMNVGMARGYGWWAQGQSAAVLDQWPAQELVRVESRVNPRGDWPERWVAAGGRISPGGRMVALKNDPVWTNLSRFGLPYPPFDYGSGMGVEDVDRDTAVSLGLIDEDTQIAPQDRGFNDDLAEERNRQEELIETIKRSLGRAATVDRDNVLHLDTRPARQVGQEGTAARLGLQPLAET